MTRRGFLPLSAVAALPAAAPRLRIERLETFVVKVNHRGNWVLVRLTATGGVTGIGDASHGADDAQQVALLRRTFELLQGRSVFEHESMRQALAGELAAGGRPGAVAWGAIEQCLWDIRGKALGLPVYDLLGGRLRERVRTYANINRCTTDRTPAGFAQWAAAAAKAGFDAVKLAPFDGMPRRPKDEAEWEKYLRAGLDCGAAVRQAIGGSRDLLIDVHSHCDLRHGLDLARRFEPLRLFWLEETTPAEPLSDLATINREAKMPTAGGESIFGVKGFHRYIAAGAVDILMPDIKYAGGLWEVRKIAALAEGAGLPVSPHGPASPVGNIAAAHLCATLPNFLILELGFGEAPWRAELVEPAEEFEAGHFLPSTRPGFGVTLNEAVLRQFAA
jgi:galactonate dehydratase